MGQVVRNSMRDDGIKGAIKVYGEALQQPDKAKAILVGTNDNTAEIVKMVLQKYQVADNPEKYGLFERTPEGGRSLFFFFFFFFFYCSLFLLSLLTPGVKMQRSTPLMTTTIPSS